ncbi:MAG: O-antigen ligase family protein [Elusimicrobia bacterium]|nr:O-antigen ligase family protein [Elusimicrobiota bacterium]
MKSILYFAIVVCPLIFFTNVTRNPYVIQGTILYISLLFIFILFLINSFKNNKIVFYRTRLDLPILVFLGFIIFTFIRAFFVKYEVAGFGIIPGYTSVVWSEGLRNNLYILINCVLAYYVAVNIIRDEKTIKKILTLSYLVAFIASTYAILQYFDIEPIWQQIVNPYGIKRCVSTFGNPVFISSFLVLMIPLAFTSFIFTKSAYEKFLYIILLIDMILALFCTMARSSWLGLGAAFIIIVFSFKEKILAAKKWFYGLILVVVLVMFIPVRWQNETKTFGFYTMDRVASIFSIEKSGPAAYQRFLIWLSAWDIAKQNPVLGCGWGLFETLFPFYQQRYLIHPMLTQRTHANNAHNVFLENLSQIGIIGLGIFLWVIFCIIKFGIHQIKNIKLDFQKTIAVGIFAGIIGMLVDNIVNVTLYFVIPGFFFWMNLGILAGFGTAEKKVLNHNSTTKILSWILIGFFLILVKMYVSIFIAEENYFTGFKLSKRSNTPIEQAVPYLEKAYKLHRLEVNNSYELANAYARMAAQFRQANAISQLDEYQKKAIFMYNEAIAANPGYDEIYFNMATIHAQRKEFDIAVENYKRAIFINPFSLDAVMGLGNIYLFSEKYEQARNIYHRAVFISSSNKDIWNNLGYVNMRLNRIDEARECYNKALSIDPNFELAKRNLSNLSIAKPKK